MKDYKGIKIIGVDHGFGNIKTSNSCFPTGVVVSDTEPPIVLDLLVWKGKYYSIGAGHKEFIADKFLDDDYYVLTLAAIARELRQDKITDAKVCIAAGLPLTWLSSQKQKFKEYLVRNTVEEFVFRGIAYRIEIVDAQLFPQGLAAVATEMGRFKGVNMLCDIGNGTMNLLRIVNKKPDINSMYTEKYGTLQCSLSIRENVMRIHHATIDEYIVTEVIRNGTANIDKDYLNTIIETAKEYTAGIFRRLREREYDPKTMKLYVVGGGGCLIKNFADIDMTNVYVNEDICATAKGYEFLAESNLKRGK